MRRLTRRTALLVGTVIVVVLAAAIPPSLGYVADLRATDVHLRTALRRLQDADLQGALGSLLRADVTASRAARARASPLLQAWTRVGPLSDEAAGLDVLTAVAGGLAEAGIEFIGTTGIARLSDLYRDGAFDLDALERLATTPGSLRDDLIWARAQLEPLTDSTSGAIARRAGRSLKQLDRVEPMVMRAESFLTMAPSFLGAFDTRRYLLALQSPSEARGGGGLIGVYGVLSFEEGRLELEHVGPVEELLTARGKRVAAPGWFVRSYGPFGSLRGDLRQVNLSPNFPPTARIMLDTYKAATGERLDGVIALDPLAIGELLRATGPLRAPGWDREINRDSVRRTLLHDIYRHFDYRERDQNEYLRGLIAVFMDSLASADLNVRGLVTGLGLASARQHLKLYATDPLVQTRIVELGVDGDYRRAGANVQVIFNNNFAANKVDFFLKRTVVTDVRLAQDGSASVKVTVSLANEAPEDKTVLVRPLNPALPFGTNHMLLGLIAPRSAIPGGVTAEGRTVIQIPRMDADRPLTLQAVEVGPGTSEDVIYRYSWPRAWDPEEGRFRMILWPQAAVRPDFFTLRVTGPPGLVWARAPGWRFTAPSQVEVGGRLRERFDAVLIAE